MFNLMLYTHIFFGSAAILSGSIALGFVPFKMKHKLWGKIFGFCLMIVYITATFMAIVKETTFLFYVAQFAGFSVAIGIRSIQLHGQKNINWIDYTLTTIGVVIALGMLFSSVFMQNGIQRAILSAVFGLAFLFFSVKTAWLIVNTNRSTLAWFQNHVAGMASGYISMVTAFCVTGLNGLMPWYVAWFGPSVVLSWVIAKRASSFLKTSVTKSI